MDTERSKQSLRHVRELQSADELDSWEIEIKGKLQTDGDAIGDATAQLHYVWGAISRKLQRKYFLPWMKKALRTNGTAPELVKYVVTTLEEPNRQWKAGQRLIKLRQSSSQTASQYVPLWEAALYEAGGEDWHDHAKILLLITSLNSATKERLDRETWPLTWTWTQFTSLLRNAETSFVSDPGTPLQRRSSSALEHGEPMDVDINAVGTRSKKQSGACHTCGKTGHWARACPQRQTRLQRLRSGSTAQSSRAQAVRDFERACEQLDELDELEGADYDDD